MALIEVSAYSAQWAIEAEKCGASRVELCAGIIEGGTTPSIGCIELTREALNIDLYVIVRPRGGDFIYNEYEFETMLKDIERIKQIGANGVVIGLLTTDNQVDIGRTRQLVDLASPMNVTFHRAFDKAKNPYQAMEEVIETGCSRILTSGHKSTAPEGVQMLIELKKRSLGRIKILPGSGIDETNICDLWDKSGFDEYHLSAKKAIVKVQHQNNPEVRFNLSNGNLVPDYILDNEKLKKVVELSNNFK